MLTSSRGREIHNALKTSRCHQLVDESRNRHFWGLDDTTQETQDQHHTNPELNMSTPSIAFYDIASGPPVRPFAPNPWKTRYGRVPAQIRM